MAYAVLLEGCKKKNQCGGELTNKYYRFSAICKKTGERETFFLGYHCGKQLMEMLGIPPIKLFNPFAQIYNQANEAGYEIRHTGKISIEFTPLGKELFDLINIVYEGLNFKNSDILDDISVRIQEKPNQDPPISYFASVNTILRKCNTTIQKILERLQENNSSFRNFDFTISRTRLVEYFKEKNKDEVIRF